MLINCVIAFLARTSARTYNEVAKIMMLPNISTVYRKTAELVTTKNDKAYCMHMHTIHSISDRARRENWTSHQQIGAIAQDSANINSGMEHDYVTNTLKGDDGSHNVATSVVLKLRNKGMYNHVADLCKHWNYVVDIFNGRDGPHSPDNADMRQSCLFDTLVWFSK
jgi:hypothetical protein